MAGTETTPSKATTMPPAPTARPLAAGSTRSTPASATTSCSVGQSATFAAAPRATTGAARTARSGSRSSTCWTLRRRPRAPGPPTRLPLFPVVYHRRRARDVVDLDAAEYEGDLLELRILLPRGVVGRLDVLVDAGHAG